MDMDEIHIEDVPEPIKKALLQLMEDKGKDKYEGWTQITTLTGEVLTRWKAYQSDNSKRRSELKMIMMKAKAIDADMDAAKAEIWHDLENVLGISHDGCYHITDDSRVLMEPSK